MNFVQKSNYLLSLFLTEIMSEKIIFGYFKQKTIFLRPKNGSVNKGKKMDIFERGQSMDFVEKWNFFLLAFFTEIISENILFHILERKDYLKWKKIEVLKRAKKWTFFKGVSPRFCPKIIISIIAVFSLELCHKRFFFDIYERKE